ncbi:ATP-binding cassette domain-containing protein [Spirochaeta isovalerica]|uniref:ABC-2 type transport system ATP-binding protein n=1 Tax=Spirochaeta isovalerica TaxID=150 RepID=A0A841R984_9SPIO|nr:ATP-binding cassette domain-containing protein [Spirochaeta isovalerica]MBB6479509.1 ABC-2 type transport system ATP-binding protein [Spirochaeta isovalerica]
MISNTAISIEGLTRSYGGEMPAVDSISLSVQTGSVYALLGPNGAGKTTTISMLSTLLRPTSGTAKVAGLDIVREPGKVRRKIGTTFQEIVLEPDFTGRENLDYHARLYGMKKAERSGKIKELLALVELEEVADRPVKTYSGGMKRRLELARGLVADPEILILDEPTQGLDPQNRTKIWEYIKSRQEQKGITVLLTTHYMDEAEAVSDRVGIIDRGKIMAEGTPRELIDQMGSDGIRLKGTGDKVTLIRTLKDLPFVETVEAIGDMVQIGVDSGNRRLAEVVEKAFGCGYRIEDITLSKPTLEDVFLKHTGRHLRD